MPIPALLPLHPLLSLPRTRPTRHHLRSMASPCPTFTPLPFSCISPSPPRHHPLPLSSIHVYSPRIPPHQSIVFISMLVPTEFPSATFHPLTLAVMRAVTWTLGPTA